MARLPPPPPPSHTPDYSLALTVKPALHDADTDIIVDICKVAKTVETIARNTVLGEGSD